jgi:hypothetical protein
MNLELFQDDAANLDLVIDTSEGLGEIFASIRTVASVMGIRTDVVERFVRLGLRMDVVNAEVPTSDGLKEVGFLNEDQIIAVMFKYSPDILDDLTDDGIRGFFHDLVEVK